MNSKIYTGDAQNAHKSNNVSCPHRAVPLSTRQIIGAIAVLSVFSFLYLGYAQHHAILFYAMTGLVAIYILFVYTSGIAAVLYMVAFDYDIDDKSTTTSSTRDIEQETGC